MFHLLNFKESVNVTLPSSVLSTTKTLMGSIRSVCLEVQLSQETQSSKFLIDSELNIN